MTMILITLAWVAGVVAADGRAVAPLPLLLLAGGGGLLAALLRPGRLRLGLVLLSASLLGAWRMGLSQPVTGEASVWRWLGQRVVLEGLVVEEPRWTELDQRLIVEAQTLYVDGNSRRAEGRVLLVLPAEPQRLPGERLLLEGRLQAPADLNASYASYLARRGVYAVLGRARLLQAAPPTATPRLLLLGLKAQSHRTILRLLPEPEASLLAGILLGLQSALPRRLYEDFTITGTSHILVISGWNISITIAGVLWATGRAGLRRWPATLLALLTVVLYVMLVGGSSAVIRAALMGALIALAAPLHRRADAWTALACACLAMSVYDPNVLWDLGFQLSAGAVAGLFACGKGLQARAERLLRFRLLRWAAEPLSATFAAQVFTLPLLLYHFGRLSLIAPLANVLLLPAVPLAMGLGALMTLLGLLTTGLWAPLGLLLAFPAWLPLAWLARGAQLLARLPLAALDVPPFPAWLLLLYYVVVIGALLLRAQRATLASTPA